MLYLGGLRPQKQEAKSSPSGDFRRPFSRALIVPALRFLLLTGNVNNRADQF
jgi:hypothetical protein